LRGRRRSAPNPFQNLREFAIFWVAEKPQLACCLFADDEEIETDAHEFDCETCPVRERLDGLWPENRAAWTLYQSLMSRFTYDCGVIGPLLQSILDPLEPEDRLTLTKRLAIIYQELIPVTVRPDGA
jgi:hypothetical protein